MTVTLPQLRTRLALLERAREIISEPARWTKEANARDAKGSSCVGINSPAAVCWCSNGALHRAKSLLGNTETEYFDAYETLRVRSRMAHRMGIVAFNDLPSVTHAEVLSLWDTTIAGVREAIHSMEGGDPV